MPLTRALLAQNSSQQQQAYAPCHEEAPLKPKMLTLAQRPNAGARNVSSPCILQTSYGTKAQSSPSSNKSGNSNSGSRKGSSSMSSCSSRRSLLGSSEFGDSSGEEDNGRNHNERNANRRLGGCFHSSQTATRPDDSNKENVAPFRCTSEDVLQQEARNVQQEQALQSITRSRRSSLMERPSFSPHRRLSRGSASSDYSVTSSALTTSRRLERTQSDNMLFSSPSSSRTVMSSPRKRSRDEAEASASTTRARLAPPPKAFDLCRSSSPVPVDDEDAFPLSSQGSAHCPSLFDSLSVTESYCTPMSSCSSDTASDRELTPPTHLKTPVETETYSSIYAHARALLRYAAGVDPAETESGLTIPTAASIASGSHVKVVGRNSERLAIQLFLQQRLRLFPSAPQQAAASNVELDGDVESACLYVCGLPGTGKTALVRSVLNSLPASRDAIPPRVAFVNCMTLSHPRLVFGKVLKALGSDAADNQPDTVAEAALSTLIRDGGQRILIVLDEMDHLLHSRAHQNILYRLFSWANSTTDSASASSCSLIGIANSLDLTERFVPLLASKGASPALLHFRPFEASEIVSVIQDRLSGLRPRYDDDEQDAPVQETKDESLPLFTSTALELLSKKIAAATGDLRKALDAARLAVELIETEQRKKAQAQQLADEKAATDSNATAQALSAGGRSRLLSHLTRESAPRVGPTQILKVLSSVLGSPNLSKIRNLGVQPKLVLLATLVALARSEQGLAVLGTSGSKFSSSSSSSSSKSAGLGGSTGLRIFDVESTYKALLRSDGGVFSALEGSELLGVFDMLEVNGVMRISSDASDSTASSSNGGSGGAAGAVGSSVVSPSGKRAAKKQLLASNRVVYLAMSADDIQRGICTPAPSTSTAPASASSSTVVADTISTIYLREKERAVKAKSYHSIAQETARIRNEELGGGRMGVPTGSL